MQYRQLGASSITVSEITLGSWLTIGTGISRDTAVACVHAALDVGITLFDTANIYGHGAAESALGEALAGVRRDSYVLATKLFGPMSAQDRGLSREQVFKQLDASLARLRTDYVDLYQCHRYDPDTPLAETMGALTEVVRQGKVRALGFSEWPVDRISAAVSMTGVQPFVSSQPQYSLLWRGPEEAVFPLCHAHGISQIVWSPLAQGVLTGKYRPGALSPAPSRAFHPATAGSINRALLSAPLLRAVACLTPLADQAGLSVAQFALAWILRRPEVASAIIGATRPDQVRENAGASGHILPADLIAAAEAIMAPFTQGSSESVQQ